MKKGLLALLSICMLVALPACYKDNNGKSMKDKGSKQEAKQKKNGKKDKKGKADKKAGKQEDKHHKKAKDTATQKAAAPKTYSSRY